MISTCLASQTDYLISTRGDTLRGQINFQWFGKIEQATVKGAKKETLPASQVRIIFRKGNTFKPVQHDGSIRFMQILSDGYLSLLGFQPDGTLNYDGRLLQKRDGSRIEVPTIGFKKQMANFLKDNEVLAKKIQDGELDRKDLDKIIADYNGSIIGQFPVPSDKPTDQPAEISKAKMLNELLEEVTISNLDTKQEALDIISDIDEKIKNKKTVPPYLINALKSNLKPNQALTNKFEAFLKVD